MANRVTPLSPYEFTGAEYMVDGANSLRQQASDPVNAAAKAGFLDGRGWGSRIVALLYKPVLFAKVAIVLVAFSILFIIKPKSYSFLDVVHTLIFGRPNSVTKPGSDEVLVQREATKAMRIIAASTMLIVAIIG
eukprot:jgi/Mesvir1/20033/Mv13284-RA.1